MKNRRFRVSFLVFAIGAVCSGSRMLACDQTDALNALIPVATSNRVASLEKAVSELKEKLAELEHNQKFLLQLVDKELYRPFVEETLLGVGTSKPVEIRPRSPSATPEAVQSHKPE